MSIEGCSLQIMRAVGVHPNQLTLLLNQFGGRLPQNEQEYQILITQLRRQGHIQEAAPGNVAHILRGPFSRPGAASTSPSTTRAPTGWMAMEERHLPRIRQATWQGGTRSRLRHLNRQQRVLSLLGPLGRGMATARTHSQPRLGMVPSPMMGTGTLPRQSTSKEMMKKPRIRVRPPRTAEMRTWKCPT